jgi:hypothetical protein
LELGVIFWLLELVWLCLLELGVFWLFELGVLFWLL